MPTKSSKFAAALKETVRAADEGRPRSETREVPATRAAAREGAKHIGGYFAPEVSKQLRALAVSEDTTVQALLAEALNMLFQSRRLPTIASATKD